jgi:FlaA1/EpsC-like NDP-sugar epimerase
MRNRFAKLALRHRRGIVVLAHLSLVLLSNYLAFWLRFDGMIPLQYWTPFVQMLPWVILVRGVCFLPFRLYSGIWRYTGIWDLGNIAGGIAVSSVACYALVRWGFGLTGYPRSIFIIDSMLLLIMLGGLRLTRRVYRRVTHVGTRKRMLIYGAGDAGEMIVRDMKHNPYYGYAPVGFIDDDPRKLGQRIHGVPVLGGRQQLPAIFQRSAPDVVVIALSRVAPAVIRDIVKVLEPLKVPIQRLPNLRDVVDGKMTVSQIRNLSVEDLLERAPMGRHPELIRELVAGKRILVTGAGGSIGSELSQQIAAGGPEALVLYERYENGLYTIMNELAARRPSVVVHPVIGDITDARRVNALIADYRPHIIFHAAAHKHVPLMELNPCEAVKNNVLGTRLLAETAVRYEVDRFILISSDKAVNPSCVMGATKRVAELLMQTMNEANPGTFVTVRFGNVLGSSGSVVPRFMDQIKRGGPVTVTHAEMRRYFMLIPEAVELVLHATALGAGGEIFVLEMGEQVKVVDLARNLIRLSGFVPEEEIPIVFTGVRPGEKLMEELVADDETLEPTALPKIARVSSPRRSPKILERQVADLEEMALAEDAKGVVAELRKFGLTSAF